MNLLRWLWRFVVQPHDHNSGDHEAIKETMQRNVHETRSLAQEVRAWRESGIWQKDMIDGTYAPERRTDASS